jgi:hypothetical protein
MGSGWLDFTTGQVVTEAELQGYLMDQSVIYFATTAARDLAITAPAQGMQAYVAANKALYFYNGSAWVFREGWGTGSPEAAVTATKGAIWHQTDGAAGATIWVKESDTTNTGWVKPVMSSIGTAKGDLIGFTASGAPVRVAVGANDQVLTADSGQSSGFKWATLPTGNSAVKRKSADESVTSSTTLQNDNDLSFAIAASEIFAVMFVLFVDDASNGSADLKVGFSVPASCTVKWSIDGYNNASNSWNSEVTTEASSANTELLSPQLRVVVHALVVNSTNAGTVQLQWAQKTSNGSAVTVRAGSHLIANKLI